MNVMFLQDQTLLSSFLRKKINKLVATNDDIRTNNENVWEWRHPEAMKNDDSTACFLGALWMVFGSVKKPNKKKISMRVVFFSLIFIFIF